MGYFSGEFSSSFQIIRLSVAYDISYMAYFKHNAEYPWKYPKEVIVLPIAEIWAPRLNTFHFSGNSKSLDFSNEMAKISHTGEVTVTFTAIVHAYCQILGKYYPMDSHPCFLFFQYKEKDSFFASIFLRRFSKKLFLERRLQACRETIYSFLGNESLRNRLEYYQTSMCGCIHAYLWPSSQPMDISEIISYAVIGWNGARYKLWRHKRANLSLRRFISGL